MYDRVMMGVRWGRRHASVLLAGATLSMGLLVLTSWMVGYPPLVTDHPPMHPWTAVAFLWLGVGMLWPRRMARAAALAVAALAAVALTHYDVSLTANMGTDPWILLASGVGDQSMAPNTAISFAFLAGALALRCPPVRGWLATAAVAIAATVIVGYILQLPPAYYWGGNRIMAMHAALGILLAAGWVILAARRRGWQFGPSSATAIGFVVGEEMLRAVVAEGHASWLGWAALAITTLLGMIWAAVLWLGITLEAASHQPSSTPSP